MTSICRVCVHVVASEAGGYNYTKDICPERGLSAQAYRCAECNTKITFGKFIYFADHYKKFVPFDKFLMHLK